MDNSKYSYFTSNQIITPNYQKLCTQILDMIKDKKIREKCSKILYEGGYDSFSVNSGMTKNDPFIEREKRAQFAYLLASNPKMFEIMAKNNVNLFHGTNANALPQILQYGMKSGEALSKMGLTVSTGEEWSRKWAGKQRNFISFTDELSTAMYYSSIQPSSDKTSISSFGVLIGISSDDAKKMETTYIQGTNLIETGIVDSVPLEKIRIIAVPKNQVKFVRKLINDDRIAVTSVDANCEFYNFIGKLANVEYNRERLFEEIKPFVPNTTFDINAVRILSGARKQSGIQNVFRRFQEKFTNRGKNNEQDSRDK